MTVSARRAWQGDGTPAGQRKVAERRFGREDRPRDRSLEIGTTYSTLSLLLGVPAVGELERGKHEVMIEGLPSPDQHTAMPALPAWITEPLWEQFAALLPQRHDTHPLGCHRPRIPDRVVFDKLLQVLVFGCAYERIADHTCSERTLRRRRDEWIDSGIMAELEGIARDGYDRLLGLKVHDLAVDGCITKAPCGGQAAGRSPVDRGKQGLKRSVVTDGDGIPLGAVVAGANTHDSPLLAPTLDTLDQVGPLPAQPTVHLDRGYDSGKTRQTLTERGLNGQIAGRGKPASLQAGRRWPVERTHAWGNAFGKLRWCTERRRRVVEFWVALAHVIIIVRRLIRRAWTCYRWQLRPHRRP